MLRNTDFLMKKQGFNRPAPSTQNRLLSLRGALATWQSILSLRSLDCFAYARNDEGRNPRSVPARLSGENQDSVLAPARMMALKSEHENEQGSAIVWILLMVALFAALNYAVSMGSRSGGATISKEQAALAATEIIDYGRAIRQAVRILQINGCSDTEISFANPVVPGYEHTPPARDECKVFHVNGGGLSYRAPQDEWMASNLGVAAISSDHYNTWYTSARAFISNVGTGPIGGSDCGDGTHNCVELITGVPFIKKEICEAINSKLGWGYDNQGSPYKDQGNSYGRDNITSTPFNGIYMSGYNMGIATPSNYSNIMTGCIEGDNSPPSGTYSFFQVLISR